MLKKPTSACRIAVVLHLLAHLYLYASFRACLFQQVVAVRTPSVLRGYNYYLFYTRNRISSVLFLHCIVKTSSQIKIYNYQPKPSKILAPSSNPPANYELSLSLYHSAFATISRPRRRGFSPRPKIFDIVPSIPETQIKSTTTSKEVYQIVTVIHLDLLSAQHCHDARAEFRR